MSKKLRDQERAEGGLIRFVPVSEKSKRAADADLAILLPKIGIYEPLKRIYPPNEKPAG